jgi:hypothetical protein
MCQFDELGRRLGSDGHEAAQQINLAAARANHGRRSPAAVLDYCGTSMATLTNAVALRQSGWPVFVSLSLRDRLTYPTRLLMARANSRTMQCGPTKQAIGDGSRSTGASGASRVQMVVVEHCSLGVSPSNGFGPESTFLGGQSMVCEF